MKCANCGNEIPENSKFCGNCGSKVEIPEKVIPQAPVEESAPVVELEDAPLFSDNGESLIEEKASAVATEETELEMPAVAPEIVEMSASAEAEESQPAPTPLHTCANCGAALRPDAKFCKGCGSAVAPVPAPASAPKAECSSCAKCGAPLKPGAKFCSSCGSTTAAEAATEAPEIKAPKKKKSKKPIIIISIILAVLLLFGGTFAVMHFTGALDDFYEAIGWDVYADDDEDSDADDDKDSEEKGSGEFVVAEFEKSLPDPTETVGAFGYAMSCADFDGMKLYVKDESTVDTIESVMVNGLKDGLATGMGITDADAVLTDEFVRGLEELVFSAISIDVGGYEVEDETAYVTVTMAVKDMTTIDMTAMSQEFTNALSADSDKLALFQEKIAGVTDENEMYRAFIEIYGTDLLTILASYLETAEITVTEENWTLEYIYDEWLITEINGLADLAM